MTTQLTEKQTTSVAKAKKPDKREAIVEAARVLFTTEGYEATTIADVAKKAGVAVGTVYLYFKNKSELLFGVKGDWEDRYLEYMSRPELQAIPHHLRARPMIEASFKLCEEQSEMVQLMGLLPQNIGDMEHNKPRVYLAVKAFYDEGIALGVFRPVDTEIAAKVTLGMVNSTLNTCFSQDGGQHQERYINTLADLLEHWLLTPEYLKKSDK